MHLFTGTFNPFSFGHESIYNKAIKDFGKNEVYIGLAVNSKKQDRTKFLQWTLNPFTRNSIIIPSGITAATFCKENGFDGLIRSMRNTRDFENEETLCHINDSLNMGTTFYISPKELRMVSSSMVRELYALNEDVTKYVNEKILARWLNKPKRILVTGKIASGKSSFIQTYFKDYNPVDLDKIAKKILPEELRHKIKFQIDHVYDMGIYKNHEVLGLLQGRSYFKEAAAIIENWMDSQPSITINKIDSSGIINTPFIFEASALGTYEQLGLLTDFYKDSVIINVDKFDIGKKRDLSEDFKNKMLSIQFDPSVIDFNVTNDNAESVAKAALDLISG